MKEPIIAKKIVVVEDNVVNQKLSQKIIGLLGHNIVQVFEATKAVDIIKAEKPDLILMDAKFPDACGIEICKSIKSDAEFKHIPIVIIKNSEDIEEPQQIVEQSGCDECLSKPFTLDIFSNTIGKYVKSKVIDWYA